MIQENKTHYPNTPAPDGDGGVGVGVGVGVVVVVVVVGVGVGFAVVVADDAKMQEPMPIYNQKGRSCDLNFAKHIAHTSYIT